MSENVKPRFEVHKLDGLAPRTVVKSKVDPTRKDKDGNPVLLGGFEYKTVQADAGWMVYFPSGASIHVWTQEEMERQGFLREPTLVDMETGDSVAPVSATSLKAKSEQINNRSRTSRVAQI